MNTTEPANSDIELMADISKAPTNECQILAYNANTQNYLICFYDDEKGWVMNGSGIHKNGVIRVSPTHYIDTLDNIILRLKQERELKTVTISSNV